MTTNPSLGEEDGTNKAVKKALIIGVSEYEDQNLESLPFCKNDAEEMYRLLVSSEIGFDIPADSNKMTGRVKETEMRNAIINFFRDKSIKSQDTLLLYFAGHGVTDSSGEVYMASSEIDSEYPLKGGFVFREITKLMNGSFSTRIITTLDCCHSGALELATSFRGDPNEAAKKAHSEMENKSNLLKQGSGKCLLAASESTQRAYEIKEKNHGIFTYYLLEGLKGKRQSVDENGNVTVDKLADYVYETISSLPPEKKPNQMPIKKVEGGGRIILAYHPDLAKRTQRLQEQTSQKDFSTREFIEKAHMFLGEGQIDKADQIFDTLLMLRPEDAEALNGKGMVLHKQNKYMKAVEYLEKALRIEPNYDDAWYNKGKVLDSMGEYEVALSCFKEALSINPNSQIFRENIREELEKLSHTYAPTKNESSKYIQKPTQEYSDTHPTGADLSYLELIEKSRMLLERGQYDEAVKIFDTLLMLRPEDAEALNGKGMTLYKQKKYKEAYECFKEALRIEPRNIVARDYLEMITHRISKEYGGEAKVSGKNLK